MSYELVWEPRGVTRRHFGHVSSREVMNAITAIAADPRFDDLHFIIIDYLGTTSLAISAIELEECVAIEGAGLLINPRIRVSVVTTTPEIIAAVKQYTGDNRSTYPRKIFSSVAEARAWVRPVSTPRPERAAGR